MKDRRTIKANLPAGVHLMNKNESKMLRKLKSQTGLTEEELRAEKKYRIILSKAQDKGERLLGLDEKIDRNRKQLLKHLTKKHKLAKEHPIVQKEFKEILFANRHRLIYGY